MVEVDEITVLPGPATCRVDWFSSEMALAPRLRMLWTVTRVLATSRPLVAHPHDQPPDLPHSDGRMVRYFYFWITSCLVICEYSDPLDEVMSLRIDWTFSIDVLYLLVLLELMRLTNMTGAEFQPIVCVAYKLGATRSELMYVICPHVKSTAKGYRLVNEM